MDDPLLLLLRAAAFAADRHRDQRRKNGDVPYVNHPLAVARILAEEAGVRDAEVLAAALLHDTVEDTDTTVDELQRTFGPRVAGIVREVTDDRRLPKATRKQQQIAHARELDDAARLVKLADKLHNLRELARLPPPDWDRLRVQGYCCWAFAVVQALGPANAALWQALQAQFAAPVAVGGATFRAVPVDAAERQAVLERYYRQLAAATD